MAVETCQLNRITPFMATDIYTDVRKARASHGVIWLVALSVIWLLSAPAQAVADESIPSFSAVYKVRYGLLRGTMTLELKEIESGYSYETSLRPAGLVSWFKRGIISERTRLLKTDGTVRPLEYTSKDTIASPDRETAYTFDWQKSRVTGKYKSQLVETPTRNGGHNRISVHVALMLALQSGTPISNFSVFDRGRWKDFEFKVIADQRARTPLGNFDTVEVRYSSPDTDKSWSLHFAPELGFHPVMLVYIEGDKVKSRAQLTEYRIDE